MHAEGSRRNTLNSFDGILPHHCPDFTGPLDGEQLKISNFDHEFHLAWLEAHTKDIEFGLGSSSVHSYENPSITKQMTDEKI